MVGLIGVLLILLTGIIGPFFVECPSGYAVDTVYTYLAPSAEHWLGTDNLGLDVFAEIVWGARTSVYVSLVAVLCSACIGIPMGLISGYFQGKIGAVIDTIIEIFMTLPMLPLMIVIAAVVGSSVTNVAVVIGILSWPSLARVTRSSTMRTSEMQFIEVSRSLGVSKTKTLFKHVLLNIIGPVMVNTWSWGLILKKSWGESAMFKPNNPYWWWLFPSLAIMIYVVCFNLLGNAVNDTLNPKTR